jgi:hypothetical protein
MTKVTCYASHERSWYDQGHPPRLTCYASPERSWYDQGRPPSLTRYVSIAPFGRGSIVEEAEAFFVIRDVMPLLRVISGA